MAAVETYLVLLSQFPDTLIVRKQGMQPALKVSQQARRLLSERDGHARFNGEQLRTFDQSLRSEGNRLNPGATADLTAAAIYIYLLQEGLHAWHRLRA